MVHPAAKKRTSLAPLPWDNSATKDTVSYLKGEKKSFPEANYTQAAFSSKERCSECVFYMSPGEKDASCEKVVGVVSADGICDLFKAGVHTPHSSVGGTEIVIRLGNGG